MSSSASPIRSLCVYCGSSPGTDPSYMQSAQELGTALAERNIRLVYGGGTNGIMGAVATSCLDAGGRVLGVIPEFLLAHEADDNLNDRAYFDRHIVPNMHERKQKMFDESDAFVALPGGIGTLEELVEIMTWSQLGRHDKPIGLLNKNGFWSPFLDLVDHMAKSGFLHNPERARLHVSPVPTDLLDTMGATPLKGQM